jgi:predicted chitinase
MGNRVVYGLTHSSNGWPMVDEGSCQWVTIPGTTVNLQIQRGQPLAILRAFCADFNEFVEPLRDRDSACWTPTNSVPSSNHLSGTACDLNWDSHPFRIADAGFDRAKIKAVRDLLAFYEGAVFWGNDWYDPKDAMHFQLASLANGGDWDTFGNPKTDEFIARKIRADGRSTYKRGTAPVSGSPVAVLAEATGVSAARAASILPTVQQGLRLSQCDTVTRIAYWLAQMGHESGGFQYTEEIQSGDESQDRWKYKGRTWIQITWMENYAGFSRWAHGKGLVDSPDYFVRNPRHLAEERWAGIGPAWYWTVARPDINGLCDAGEFDTVTYRINGGQNGAADRRARLQKARAVGDRLLALVESTTEHPTSVEELLMADTLYPSVSIYKTPGEGPKYTLAQLIQSIDGMRHRETVEEAALLGSLEDIDRVAMVAAGKGAYTDLWAVNHAKQFLVKLENVNPDALRAYLTSKGIR